MSKAISYFDWEMNFRKKALKSLNSENETMRITYKENVNSLGISDNEFKDFMKKWKNENL